ncbi:MAG: AraC family ligand binding domain-containing protein, partial [Clostridia bacterium]|nr:AraC family ligand binding domain-containing protein [Clostridia bacterium]
MFYEFRNIGDSEYVRVDTENNMNFPKHIHQSFEIMLMTDGEMDVTVDDRVYTLKKGDAVLIFPNQVHSLRSEESKHITFVFSPLLVNAYFSKLNGRVPKNAVFQPGRNLTKAL